MIRFESAAASASATSMLSGQQQFRNKHVFAPAEITSLIVQLRAEYSFPRPLSERRFQRSLIEYGVLKEISVTSSYSLETTRCHFGLFSDYELALSLKSGAYLSNGTAAHLHNLIDEEHDQLVLT
jgi:hypothetical protein